MGRGAGRGRLPGLRDQPVAVSRYRDRHAVSGAKSDPGDAPVLADLVRTDRHQHRPMAGRHRPGRGRQDLGPGASEPDLDAAAPAQPAALDAARVLPGRRWTRSPTTSAEPRRAGRLARAPTPEQGRGLSLSALGSTLRRGGRQRNLEPRAQRDPDRAAQPSSSPRRRGSRARSPPACAPAWPSPTTLTRADRRARARARRRLLCTPGRRDRAQSSRTRPRPRRPGLGEFGDAPNRYQDAKRRRCYAGTAPITRASGTRRIVLARFARNRRLADACYLWAFAALTRSRRRPRLLRPPTRPRRDPPPSPPRLANRLVGILHGCLRHHTPYDETTAWAHTTQTAA